MLEHQRPKSNMQTQGTLFYVLPSQNVSTSGRRRASSDGRLPVGLINKDSSEVSDNVDDSEHETIRGKHGKVGSIAVSTDGTTSVLASFVEGICGVTIGREDFFTFLFRVGDSVIQEPVDGIRRVNLDVNVEDHCDEHGKDNDGVDVRRQESGLKTSRGSVEDNTPGDQERGKSVIHTGKSFNGSSSSKQKHRSDNDIGAEGKEKEGLVGGATPSGIDDFADSVGGGGNLLEGDGENSEQQHLNGSSRSIPKGLRGRD